ncbi:hypothetical protein [Nostoc sp. MG11]|uniref:hypothetical protein n=1 Tax=Nostoc sp. MG11 TaxID=2721166 RepID=UPI0018683423|nr:hypothetical protein [Nostoc sp. MG11]
MTKFQDPRARAIAAQIEAINVIGYESAYDPVLQNHVIQGGLSPVEGILRFDMFMGKVQQAAKNREAVWAFQLSQNISGIEWYTVEYGGITAELPRLHEDLKCVPGDKQILMQSKPVALDFLAYWNQVFKVWRYDRETDERWNRSKWSQFDTEYLRREWIEIWVEDYISTVLLQDGTCREEPVFAINACCYWGNPMDVHRTDAYLQSGSSWFQWNNFTPWR